METTQLKNGLWEAIKNIQSIIIILFLMVKIRGKGYIFVVQMSNKIKRACWNCKNYYKCEETKKKNGVCKNHKFWTRLKLNDK